MAIHASALKRDLEIMEDGDSTLVGDRGVSLSGGQKARVSLARAIYFDADVYLLDDPLSAVDTSVGKHIMEKCICGVLKNKPCILITHQVQHLPKADKILILKDGQVMNQGTYEELTEQGIDFQTLVQPPEEEEAAVPDTLNHHKSHASLYRSHNTLDSQRLSPSHEQYVAPIQPEEDIQRGTLSFKLYLRYFYIGTGVFGILLCAFLNIAASLLYVMCDWWLAVGKQSEAVLEHRRLVAEQGPNSTLTDIPEVQNYHNLSILAAITGSCFLFGLFRSLDVFHILVSASKNIHNDMFASVIRSPTKFFDVNPPGRILNRFSKDIGLLDDLLPYSVNEFLVTFLQVIGIVLVACVVNPWVLIGVIPLGMIFILLRKFYLQTSRAVKRIEGVARSPALSHLSSTVHGLHTVRAYGVEAVFMEEFHRHQDVHSSAWFLFISTMRWFVFHLDTLCAAFITVVTLSSVAAAKSLDGGLVGMSVSSALTLMGTFQWAIRQSAEVENLMTSVERVSEYCELEPEAPLEIEGKKPAEAWPESGVVEAKNLSLRYDQETPFVLRDLTFTIRAQEKVGIVGRTGAGKSSLITVLFRMTEPEGLLNIDGLDIQGIGLHDLRSKISIIPQDPMLFTGTVRSNLDPFNQHGDDVLWQVLGEVELQSAVKDLTQGLDSLVSEGGVNFSVGQRQLVCLARAILTRNRILVIDEATANVDPSTDALIQETIRKKFHLCTVLTVAHRLHTIVDSDRVMVLDSGEILEFDAPATLLSDTTSNFYQMAAETGPDELSRLIQTAEVAHTKNSEEGAAVENGLK
ncbi:hypothetical protein CAPTEDRAFT_148727 [Capitella teleta]|uniref:Cystic fibrosis transmembrane conductance regulator n=1 Tax=Capitella teleta TaxID=283909 RepID=R7TA14_CAPTE|nr:hypothetical protein CAPTEDRAFT_148727 [Capitella teleta]|eukprot:ELT90554.1 hypothetical protein CAPTEDRAFT_148727 [Capitella teleta]